MTFLDGSSLWNELNTMVALKVFEGVSVEVAVKQFCKEYKIGNVRDFVRFLRLSDELIASVLYVGEFARERLFFRRVRVPPLLWVYWDMVLVNRLTRALVRAFVPDRRRVAEVSRRAAVLLEEWRALGVRLGLSKEELRFQFVTFRLLIVCREHLLLKRDAGELADVVEAYHLLYPEGYVFLVEGGDGGLLVRWLVRRLVRRGHRYGVINWAVFDRVVCFMLGRVVRRLKLPLDGRGMTTGVILK